VGVGVGAGGGTGGIGIGLGAGGVGLSSFLICPLITKKSTPPITIVVIGFSLANSFIY
jgi:hypothetical protein